MRGLTFSLIAASAIAGLAALASAQPQQAGVSAAVRGQVALARASQSIVGKKVQSGDPIFLGDSISSGKASGMQVMLLDETVFTIGPNSEISIDEFVYDPVTSAGKITASVAKGAFRFITGKIARKRPEDMTVKLPTATIGIRGTIVAGYVRSEGDDDSVGDKLFEGLKEVSPNAAKARDFVVLLGPGDENNTNDEGGAFIFAPRPPQKAGNGLSAGSPAVPGGLNLDETQAIGNVFIQVSRTNSGVIGFRNGTAEGPFIVPPVANFFTQVFSAQPPGEPTGNPNDPNAQDANNTSPATAGFLSGNNIAETVQVARTTMAMLPLEAPACTVGCSSPGSFDFADLRQITTGQAFFSQSSLNLGPFFVSSLNIDLFFGSQQMQFNLTGISGGGVSSGQITCNSTCFIDYSNSAGAAIFTDADNPATNKSGCSSCSLSIGITSASSSGATANVTLQHDGNTGSTSLSSN